MKVKITLYRNILWSLYNITAMEDDQGQINHSITTNVYLNLARVTLSCVISLTLLISMRIRKIKNLLKMSVRFMHNVLKDSVSIACLFTI